MTITMRPCVLLLLLPGIIALSVEFDERRPRSPLRTFTINGPHHFYSPFVKRPETIVQKHLEHFTGIRPTQTTQQSADSEENPVQGSENNEYRPLWQWIHNQHHHGGHHPGQGLLASHLHHKFTATETVVSTVVVYVPDQAQQATYTIYVPTTSYIVQDGHHHTHTVTTTRTSVINAGVTVTEAEQLSGGEAVLHVDTVTRTRTITSVSTSTQTINAGVTITEAEQLSGGEVVLHVETTTVTVPTTKTLLLPTTTVIVSQQAPITRTSTSVVYVPKTTTVRETVSGPHHIPPTVTRTTTRYQPKTSTIYVPSTRTVVRVDPDWTTTETITLATATRTVSEIVLKTTYLPTTVTVNGHGGDDDDGTGNGDGDNYPPHYPSPYWPQPTKTVTKTKTKTKTVALATYTSYVPDETWTITTTDYEAPTVYIPSVSTVVEPPETVTLFVPRTTVVSTSTTTVRVPTTLTKSCESPSGGGYHPGQGHGGPYHPGGEDGHGHGGGWPQTYPPYYPWPDTDYPQHTVTLTVPERCSPTSTSYETITVSAHQYPDEHHGHHEHYTRTTTSTVTKTKTNTLTVPTVTTETLYVPTTTTTTEIVEGFETVTLPASTVTVEIPTTTTETSWVTDEPDHYPPSHHQHTVTVTVWPSEEHHHPPGHHHATVTITSPSTVTLTTPMTITKTKTKSTTVTRVAVTSVTKTVQITNQATTTVTYYPDPSTHPHPHPHPHCNLVAIESALLSLENLVVKIQTLVIRLTENVQHHPPCDGHNGHSQRPPVGNLEAILSSLGELMDALKHIVEQHCPSGGATVRPPPAPRPPHKPCGQGGHGNCQEPQINAEVLASLTTALEDLIESVGGIIQSHEQATQQGPHGQYEHSEDYEDDLRKQLELVKGLQSMLASQYVTDKFSDVTSEYQVSSLLSQPMEKIGSLQNLMRHPENMAKKPLLLANKLGLLVADLNKIRSLVNSTEWDDYDSKKLSASNSTVSVSNSTQKPTVQEVMKIDKDAPIKNVTEPFIIFGQNGGKPRPTNFLSEKENGVRNSTTPKRKTPPNVATAVSAPVVQQPVNDTKVPEKMTLISEVKKSIVPPGLRSSAPTALSTSGKRRKSKISSEEWS